MQKIALWVWALLTFTVVPAAFADISAIHLGDDTVDDFDLSSDIPVEFELGWSWELLSKTLELNANYNNCTICVDCQEADFLNLTYISPVHIISSIAGKPVIWCAGSLNISGSDTLKTIGKSSYAIGCLGTLTIGCGANIVASSAAGAPSVVYAKNYVSIECNASVKITANAGTHGIKSDNGVIIDTSGTVEVTFTDGAAGDAVAICGESIVIKNGTVKIYAEPEKAFNKTPDISAGAVVLLNDAPYTAPNDDPPPDDSGDEPPIDPGDDLPNDPGDETDIALYRSGGGGGCSVFWPGFGAVALAALALVKRCG